MEDNLPARDNNTDKQNNAQEQNPLKQIETFVRERLHSLSHGFDHTRRVYNLCLHMGQIEDANLHVLLPAALLHDIGRDFEEHLGVDHAESADYLAKDFLKQINYPEKHIGRIFDAIKHHRTSGENDGTAAEKISLEAQILSDADKLDSLGAIGLARVFTFGGSRGRDVKGTVTYFKSRIEQIKNSLSTGTAMRIADERILWTSTFLKRLDEENEGLR